MNLAALGTDVSLPRVAFWNFDFQKSTAGGTKL